MPIAVEPSCHNNHKNKQTPQINPRFSIPILNQMNKFVDSPLYLDGFNSIFHLKQSTFRREGINSPIVLGPFDKTFENKYFLSNRIYVDNQKGEKP